MQIVTHPLFLNFGETSQMNFPIILIIGREPNNDSISDATVGQYDFKTHPKCAFWNTAFKLVGSYNDITTAELKKLFIKNNSSPIVFTDASPKGIPNIVSAKNKIRSTLAEAEIKEHIKSIFNNEKLINRVKFVLFSGLENNKYNMFKTLFNEQAIERQIPITEISFLIGNNYPKIQKKICDKEIKILIDVYKEYETTY